MINKLRYIISINILLFTIFISFSFAGYKSNSNIEIDGDITASGIKNMSGGTFNIDSYVAPLGSAYLWFGDIELFAGFLSIIGNSPYMEINSAIQKTDGSGNVDISIACSDPDKDYSKVKVEWSTSTNKSAQRNPATLTGNATASVGTAPDISAATYQIGSTVPIQTTSTNTVTFVWDSKTDIPDADDTYYIIITISDGYIEYYSTTGLVLDNTAPKVSKLSETSKVSEELVTLSFGAPAIETNFSEYKIYYSTNPDVTIDTSIWDKNNNAALGYQDYNTETEIEITGLLAKEDYYFNLYCFDTYGNNASSTTIGPITTKSIPTLTAPIESISTDGTGLITFTTSIYDADNDSCTIKVEYSLDNGSSWYQAYLSNILLTTGSTTIDNTKEYQLGVSTDIITPNDIIITWDTRNPGNENGNIVESTDVLLRITPKSEKALEETGEAKVSASKFTVDNSNPKIPGNLIVRTQDLTASSITWDFASSSDTTFSKYELWYATFSPVTRQGTDMSLWTTSDDSALSNNTTSSTTITGLTEGTTYYARIWAIDTFGNMSYSVSESLTGTEWMPRVTADILPDQSTNGDGRVAINVDIDDYDRADNNIELKIEYSTTSPTGPWQKTYLESSNLTVSIGSVPNINNASEYQIGDTQNIDVSSGKNSLYCIWLSSINIPNIDTGNLYLRFTTFDGTNLINIPVTKGPFEVDNINPLYASSSYSHDTQTLYVKFDEQISPSIFVSSGVQLTDGLTESLTIDEHGLLEGTTVIKYVLTDSHRNIISRWQRQGALLKIELSTDVVKDTRGNINLAQTEIDITDWSKDTSFPSILSAEYSFFTKTLTMDFSEIMSINSISDDPSTLTINGIRIQDKQSADSGTNYINLTSSDTINESYDSEIITITLGDTNWRNIASWGSNKKIYIALYPTVIDDIAGNFVTEVHIHSALEMTYLPDTTAPEIIAYNPASNAVDIDPVNQKVEVTFTDFLYEPDTAAGFSIKAIRDNLGNDLNVPITGTVEFFEFFENNDTSKRREKLVFTPAESFRHNHRYQVELTANVQDISRNKLSEKRSWIFTTIMNYREDNINIGDDEETTVTIPKYFLDQNGYLITNTDPFNKQNEFILESLITANTKKEKESLFDKPIIYSTRELNIYNKNNENLSARIFVRAKEAEINALNDPGYITISIPYPDSDNNGIVNYIDPETKQDLGDTDPAVRVNTLRMYCLDEEHKLWVKIPGGTVDTDPSKKTLSTKIKFLGIEATKFKSGVYTIVGTRDDYLGGAYAYPVPFKPSEPGHNNITFTNLASECDIKIFTISGELVNTINHTDGRLIETWDVKASSGEDVFSGVYIYFIKSPADKKTGKLMIIR